MPASSPNFAFLAAHDAQLVRLGALAERYFADDPSTCLIKLRQLGEALAQITAAYAGLLTVPDESQADRLRRLRADGVLPREVGDLFHQLRVSGNRAAHQAAGDHAEALAMLKVARQLGVWFHRTFGDPVFAPGPFAPPRDPLDATAALQAELDRLRQDLDATRSEAEKARVAAEQSARAHLSAEERARQERAERALWEQLAAESDQATAALAAQLQALQAAAAQAPTPAAPAIVARAEAAARRLVIDEATTRAIIDAQLRARGWDADTSGLRFADGDRISLDRICSTS
jgi:type I restriction enzyme R subunit